MSHVSLRDVAAEAGVSFQTVSKVLNGEGRVAPATRERILHAAAELGYVPNTLARSLATRRTHTIGFIGSGLASFVLGPLMHGADRASRERGHLLLVTLAEGSGDHLARQLQQLRERRVDGIINAALTLQHRPRYGEQLRQLAPTVSLWPVAGGDIPVIGHDPAAIGRLATDHLLGLGHRVIGMIAGELDERSSRAGRRRGYEQALRAAGIPVGADLMAFGHWSPAGGYAAMQALLARRPDLTAIFAHNDHMAIGAVRALREAGRQVPGDCAIIGCDDIDLAAYAAPPLTTIRMSFDENGALAATILIDHLTTQALLPAQTLLPAELVVRASCGAIAPSLPLVGARADQSGV